METCSSVGIARAPKNITDWAKNGDVEKVRECLDRGDDPNTSGDAGWSLLHAACIIDSPEMAVLLLERNADLSLVDNGGNTPLHYAAIFGSVECCQILLDYGADLEAKNQDQIYYVSRIPVYSGGGRTPLMAAVLKQEEDTVNYLLSRGADARKVEDNDGRTAYDLACRDSKLTFASLLAPEKETHVFVKEPINIPQRITQRVSLIQDKQFSNYKKFLLEFYKPKHPDVYKFSEECFDETFLNAIKIGTSEALMSVITEIHPKLYTFPMLKSEFCDKLLDELSHFEKTCTEELKIGVRRPNSMNNYGVILDDIGFSDAIHAMMVNYVCPFSKILYKNNYGDSLDNHHCFLVRYKTGEDLDLALHVDDAEVTLNVCLGREFTGGTLNFYGIKGETNNNNKLDTKFVVSHKKGVALLHLGNHWHEANKIESGERSNLILWCRSKNAKPRTCSRKK